MLPIDIKGYRDFFNSYTELRQQENRNLTISMINGDIAVNKVSTNGGISARVYKNGVWGFSSSPDLTDDSVKKVIKSATDNSIFLNSRLKMGKSGLMEVQFESINDLGTKKIKYTQKELINYLKEIDTYILENYSDITSRTLVFNSLEIEKQLYVSTNSYSLSNIPRANLYILLSISKNGETTELYDIFGGLGNLEDNFKDPKDIFPEIDNIYYHLKNKVDGIYPEGGIKDVILDADLAGILAHEAIGHTTEADLVLGGSIAAEYMDKVVASPLITLVDYANSYNGEYAPVPLFVDDEGVEAKDVTIIDKGVLKSYMHNKESALHFNVKPTGNARGYQFFDEPLIRMRNTAIVPGKSELNDMISSIDDGYYLMRSSNGQADTTSEFMFGVVKGYEIKGGKIKKAIKDTTISGVAFDMLKTVTMVSKDISWSSGGMCGKKQLIPVGMGGPAIKCKINIGGR